MNPCLALLLCLITASPALAMPVSNEILSVSIRGIDQENQTLHFFRDSENPKNYWWLPYRLELDRTPHSLRPLANWYPDLKPAKIELAARLTRLPPQDQIRALKGLAQQESRPETEVRSSVKTLPLDKISLMIQAPARDERGLPLILADWQSTSSFTSGSLPQSITLGEIPNQLMLSASQGGRPDLVAVALGVRVLTLAQHGRRIIGRSYLAYCAKKQLERLSYSGTVSRRQLLPLIFRLERYCVRQSYARGVEDGFFQIADAWINELQKRGALAESNEQFRILDSASIDAWKQNAVLGFHTLLSDREEILPLEFGTLATHLKPIFRSQAHGGAP